MRKIVIKMLAPDYRTSALDYLLNRLSRFEHHQFPTTQQLDDLIARDASREISLVSPADFPLLSAAQQKVVDDAITCARTGLAQDYPLLPGELLVGETFTYLSAPYDGFPAGTAVLRQQTNFALLYFFFPRTIIQGAAVTRVPPPSVLGGQPQPPQPAPMAGVLASLALQLASGLLSGIGKQIGAMICNQIFSATGLNYFEPTTKTLKKIVNGEITSAVISIINGKINGTKDWIRIDYTPNKEFYTKHQDLPTYAKLDAGLSDFANDMYTQVIGPLKEDAYAEPGFAVFLIGAGVHLSLYQEHALIDNRVKNPADSTFATSVGTLANDYASFAQATYDKIITNRKKLISCHTRKVCSCNTGYPVCNEFWVWEDSYSGESERFDTDKDTGMDECEKKCREAADKHTTEALVQLNTDLGDPNTIIPSWRKLAKQPIPKV